jgi:hypothetical protein
VIAFNPEAQPELAKKTCNTALHKGHASEAAMKIEEQTV